MWAPSLTMPLAILVALLEAGVGTAGIVSTAFWDAAALQVWLLTAAGLLYAMYATYGLYLLRRRPGVPCACSHDSDPISASVVARAAGLAGLAVVALLHVPVAQGLSGLEVVVVALAASAYGITLWVLPTALHDPLATVMAGQARGVVG
jgi:hypothetical protein